MEPRLDIISATVKEFCRISGLGESTVWSLIADGRIETIAIGRRRLVLVDSYRRLIEQQRATPADARRNTAVPALGSKRRDAIPSSVTDSEPKTMRRGRVASKAREPP